MSCPAAAMTRTALVELFETPVTLVAMIQTPSDSPAEITPLAVMPSETSATTPTATIEFSPPVFAEPPPGKIVFTCTVGDRDQICLMNADGSDRVQLTSTNANQFLSLCSARWHERSLRIERRGRIPDLPDGVRK